MTYGQIEACQVCASRALTSVLFLGYLPPVNHLRPIRARPSMEYWYPAELLYCPTCHLVQLGYAVDPQVLFPPEYPYTSSSTRILRENFANLYQEAAGRLRLSREDLVVDIGSNDGTLLKNFQQGGCRVLGIEPTRTAEIAHAGGIPTLMAFFNQDTVRQVKREHGVPRLVAATNVFAHIHGIHQVMEWLEELLEEQGVFISESHYLPELVSDLQYDAIYHEHLRYYSLTSLNYLFRAHGFRVFFARRIPTHGGSLRVYASRSSQHPVDESVDRILKEEAAAGFASGSWIDGFRQRVVQSKLDLYAQIRDIRAAGRSIYGIGAPSRASTLINYVRLDKDLLECVLEIESSKKVGSFVPGTDIPILNEAKLFADQPDYALLLSWHIAEELCRVLRQRGYRGEFVIPLPVPRVVPNPHMASL